jgi:hypothetical protein
MDFLHAMIEVGEQSSVKIPEADYPQHEPVDIAVR